MKTKRGIQGYQYSGVIQKLLARYFHLLAKSCKRYKMLKESAAPEILVEMEKVLIRKHLLFLLALDGAGRR